MRIFVNDREVSLLPGMTVRHALTALSGSAPAEEEWLVRDQWGNRLGLDGALQPGGRITAVRLEQAKQGNGLTT